ncbi:MULTISPECIES: hypothetical protein [Mesorhizobium]|uniref:hypothetical protein n=1 Tax=Mesorhizobium sp. TaxID=1871066 RepID=UPI000AC2B268|nr:MULTISPECIES: hypothetical protein [Mesorhizobium]RWM75799.1 MAG: hypothetical protein EOR82_03985 [Mesorhizobium sp.]TJV58899.1 MAG: hypothetical protein E5X82_17910 [Mesorhizobium sp.]
MSFEINWRRPDESPRPTDLLTGEHCDIEKFDLLSEAITATVIAKRPGTKAGNGIRNGHRQLEAGIIASSRRFRYYLLSARHSSATGSKIWHNDREAQTCHFMADACRNGSATG